MLNRRYTLWIGNPPFETEEVKATYKKIERNDYCFPREVEISHEAKSLIRNLLQPNPKAPPAFPRLPLGMDNFIDIAAATAALSLVPGLQYKHYMMVPKKLDERSFWVNFFSHVTAIQLNA